MAGPLGVNATHGATTWANYVLEHLTQQSALLRAGVRFVATSGRVINIPRTLSDAQATWVAEGVDIPSDSPTGDALQLVPKKLADTVVLSNESIQDSSVNELNLVGASLTRAVAVGVDNTALSANAATAVAPAGLLSYALQPQTGGVDDVDSFLAAIGTIEAVGGVADTIFMNPADKTALTLVKDATGSSRPLLIPDPQQRQSYQIGGATIYPTPGIAPGKSLVCEAAQIVVAVSKAIEVTFSAHARFSADSTMARVVFRADWGINDPRGLVVVGT